jgi:RNA polymerase sigma-70 factor, ECF subfamily
MGPAETALDEVFRASLDSGARERLADPPSHTKAVLAELHEMGRAAHPTLHLPVDAFATYLAGRLPPDAASVDALRALSIPDLYLACACVRGDAVAIGLFDAAYLANVGALVPRMAGGSPGDVVQAVREKLFVGPRAKLVEYSGRGDLAGWVRVVAVRTALNLGRGQGREVGLREDDVLADKAGAASGDTELVHLKLLYKEEFRDAFGHALTALEPRDRNMLRQHYIDGLTMERIGTLYGVHRATVIRRIHEARKAIAEETRRRLKTKLGVSRGEVESILRLIGSRLDLSLRAYLGDDVGDVD